MYIEFEINNSKWIIKFITNAELEKLHNADYIGLTVYKENTIYIANDVQNIEKTLKHELTHCWLWEYGHNQHDKKFDNEDICEIVSASNDFINDILEKYLIENTKTEDIKDDYTIGFKKPNKDIFVPTEEQLKIAKRTMLERITKHKI